MTLKVLTELLTKYGQAEKVGETMQMAGDRGISLFVNIGDDTLNIAKVKEFDLLHEVLVVTTTREERYAIAYEDVRAVHFGAPQSNKPGYWSAE